MAQKIQTLFVDDIDGSAAEGTIRFGLDGTDYEIDLSAAHAADLRAALARSSLPARKVRGAAAWPGRPQTANPAPDPGRSGCRDQESWPPRWFMEADRSSPRIRGIGSDTVEHSCP